MYRKVAKYKTKQQQEKGCWGGGERVAKSAGGRIWLKDLKTVQNVSSVCIH